LIYQSGISEIYFIEKYQNEDGLKFLKKAGVQSYQVYGLDDYQKLEYEVNE